MLSVFPVAYFGPISYFRELARAENPVFEQWETFPRRSLRNRCQVLDPNGFLELSVPVNKPADSKTKTKDVRVDYSTDWQKKHWRTFMSSYASSPFFDHYGMEVEELIFSNPVFLVDFNRAIHEKINGWLDLGVPFELCETYLKENIHDFRNDKTFGKQTDIVPYQQVFVSKAEFISDLSILDAVFNLGPMARKLILP
ncbi:MAG: WbqC-like family protein [Crocinitomicaceae bacterium]|jgi:hypothetical protein|nr:WbqC-like family protein [Crocinitomicaceae bacterium]